MLQFSSATVIIVSLLSSCFTSAATLSISEKPSSGLAEREVGLESSRSQLADSSLSEVDRSVHEWEKVVENSRIRLKIFGGQVVDNQSLRGTLSCLRSLVDHIIENLPAPDHDKPLAADHEDPFHISRRGPPLLTNLLFSAESMPGRTGDNRLWWSDLEAVAAGLYSVMVDGEKNFEFGFEVWNTERANQQLGNGILKRQHIGGLGDDSCRVFEAPSVSKRERKLDRLIR